MTAKACARVRSSRTVATRSRSTLFRRSRCTADFKSWYTLKFSPDCFFSSSIGKGLTPLGVGVIWLNSAMRPLIRKLSPAPQTQYSAAFLFLPHWLLADISSPFMEIFSYLRIGYLAKRIAPTNRLQNVNVLIRYLPEKFLTNYLFDLCFR